MKERNFQKVCKNLKPFLFICSGYPGTQQGKVYTATAKSDPDARAYV